MHVAAVMGAHANLCSHITINLAEDQYPLINHHLPTYFEQLKKIISAKNPDRFLVVSKFL